MTEKGLEVQLALCFRPSPFALGTLFITMEILIVAGRNYSPLDKDKQQYRTVETELTPVILDTKVTNTPCQLFPT